MNKRKALIISILVITILVIWIIEPLSLNPFSKVEIPVSKGEFSSIDAMTSQGIKQDFETKTNQKINEYLKSGNFLGVSVGLYKEGVGTFSSGAGFADKSEQKRIDMETLFRIASITKPMTAIAIMQLYEKGKLDLDLPIQTYVKEFPTKAKGQITIRQLLKHSSGIPHYSSKWDAMSFTYYPSLTAAMEAFKMRELAFEPGTQYLYSSFGYTILGAIIESVSGMSYETYMKKNIWEVAGMTNTSLEKDSKAYKNKSSLYIKIKSTYIISPKTDLSIIYAAGGVHSTAGDLLKFGKAILENNLIQSSTLDMMINETDELAPSIGDDPYGFGWSVYDDPDYGRIIQHGGAQPGASSFFSIYLDQNMVSTVLSNSFGSRQNAFHLSRDMALLALE